MRCLYSLPLFGKGGFCYVGSEVQLVQTSPVSRFQKGGDGPQTIIGTGAVTMAVETQIYSIPRNSKISQHGSPPRSDLDHDRVQLK
jgi:hypothetical protein